MSLLISLTSFTGSGLLVLMAIYIFVYIILFYVFYKLVFKYITNKSSYFFNNKKILFILLFGIYLFVSTLFLNKFLSGSFFP